MQKNISLILEIITKQNIELCIDILMVKSMYALNSISERYHLVILFFIFLCSFICFLSLFVCVLVCFCLFFFSFFISQIMLSHSLSLWQNLSNSNFWVYNILLLLPYKTGSIHSFSIKKESVDNSLKLMWLTSIIVTMLFLASWLTLISRQVPKHNSNCPTATISAIVLNGK